MPRAGRPGFRTRVASLAAQDLKYHLAGSLSTIVVVAISSGPRGRASPEGGHS